MPKREESAASTGSDGKTWAEWKQELLASIEELDKACANARQLIYRMRPLLRPKPRRQAETAEGDDDELAERRTRSRDAGPE